jgi:hypothetical protein
MRVLDWRYAAGHGHRISGANLFRQLGEFFASTNGAKRSRLDKLSTDSPASRLFRFRLAPKFCNDHPTRRLFRSRGNARLNIAQTSFPHRNCGIFDDLHAAAEPRC